MAIVKVVIYGSQPKHTGHEHDGREEHHLDGNGEEREEKVFNAKQRIRSEGG